MAESRRQAPWDRSAEESLVGAMLLSRAAWDAASALVLAEDFYEPNLRRIYGALLGAQSNDPVAIMAWLDEHDPKPPIARARLAELAAATPASAQTMTYAKIVVSHATRRRLIGAGERIVEMGFDLTTDVGRAHTEATSLLAGAELPVGGEPDPDVAEFVAMSHQYEWAIPGLLEVMDRLLLVAPEKYGKSTLIRQIAVCCSQGLDPFRFHDIPRCNVLLVDLENPAPLVRRKLRPLVDNCANRLDQRLDPGRLRIISRPEGMDITHRPDEYFLHERLESNLRAWAAAGWLLDPLIVCIGPIYKLHNAEDERAADARKVQQALDRIRTRYRATLIMETHAPHESFGAKAPARSLRPAGSRVWLRWPEFCRGIEPAQLQGDVGVAEFYDVQGARDERDWPYRLRRGGRWPWEHDASL